MLAQNKMRLSTAVVPLRYAITLTPDLAAFTFAGDEAVELEVKTATDTLTLHAQELEVLNGEVLLPDGTIVPAREIRLDEATQTVTLSFGRELSPGRATLRTRFNGFLNDQLRGFYRSRSVSPDGSVSYFAATQFEATDARRAFPCWDEPALKAVFQVNLVISQDLVAVSNMPILEERTHAEGKKLVRFADSPRMSTYLLAFVIGDFGHVEATAPSGTLVRVWATKGNEKQGELALSNAVRILEYFNQYFGIPYPLEKLDHIAIPDFASGAMENWGLITYRETALLYDPANSAANTQQRIVEVVAHEMAHMWFGDLVTMEWWDDLWLNESFASWIGDKAVDALHPDWHMWTQFVSNDTNAGLGLDALRNSHHIEAPVSDPNQIREIFDAITYSKGAALLRMLEDYLGADTFQRGLQRYIARHQYGNARTADLWTALAEASGEPVAEVMDTWVKQIGYPVLRASVEARSDSTLHVSQRRFLYEAILGGSKDDPTLWNVPVRVVQDAVPQVTSALMTGRELRVPLPQRSQGGRNWTKVNAGQTGFYRVHYDDDEWERLRAAIEAVALPAIDRLGLQNDAYALARAGVVPATRFLSMASGYRNEVDAIVWGDLAANLGGIENLILGEAFLPQFDTFAQSLFHDIVRKVGWDARPEEGHLDALLRSIVLGVAGSYGDPAVLAESRRRFQDLASNPSMVHPNIRGIVVGLTAQQGDAGLFEHMRDLARQATFQEEKLRFLRGLGRFPQKDLMQKTLEIALDTAEVRTQDTVSIMGSVVGNRKQGRTLAWDFIRANWSELDRRYGSGGAGITAIVSYTGGFTSMERATEVEEFFRSHPAPAAARGIQQALERIRLNAAWLERNRAGLAAWLQTQP